MKVRAIKLGYYDLKRRRVGHVFDMPDAEAAKCSWVEPASKKVEAPEEESHEREPVALSSMQKGKRGAKAKATGDAEVI